MGGSINRLVSALGTQYYTSELKGVAHLNVHTHAHFTHTHFSFIFLILFTGRACSQLAQADLDGSCLNKEITKIYRQKLINKKKKYNIR